MFDKMKQVYEMQKKARELQKALESIRLEKTSRDGMLKVTVNGTHKVEALVIDPSYLESGKKEALERGLSSLINDAFGEIQKQSASQMAGMLGGLA